LTTPYDSAKIFAELVRDKNRLKAQIAKQAELVQIGKASTGFVRVSLDNVVMLTRDTSADNKWGIDNWNEILWQRDWIESQVEVTRRKWGWATTEELEVGTYDDNIDLSFGDIRLG